LYITYINHITELHALNHHALYVGYEFISQTPHVPWLFIDFDNSIQTYPLSPQAAPQEFCKMKYGGLAVSLYPTTKIPWSIWFPQFDLAEITPPVYS